jgi:hypothetical protein
MYIGGYVGKRGLWASLPTFFLLTDIEKTSKFFIQENQRHQNYMYYNYNIINLIEFF